MPQHDRMILAEVLALTEKGYVTREEYEQLACNSYEKEYLHPFLTDDALHWLMTTVMLPNCTPLREGGVQFGSMTNQ